MHSEYARLRKAYESFTLRDEDLQHFFDSIGGVLSEEEAISTWEEVADLQAAQRYGDLAGKVTLLKEIESYLKQIRIDLSREARQQYHQETKAGPEPDDPTEAELLNHEADNIRLLEQRARALRAVTQHVFRKRHLINDDSWREYEGWRQDLWAYQLENASLDAFYGVAALASEELDKVRKPWPEVRRGSEELKWAVERCIDRHNISSITDLRDRIASKSPGNTTGDAVRMALKRMPLFFPNDEPRSTRRGVEGATEVLEKLLYHVKLLDRMRPHWMDEVRKRSGVGANA